MSRYVQFVTPENIEVSYELAGIGSRFVAALIDHLLQVIIVLVAALIANWLMVGMLTTSLFSGSAPSWVAALLGLFSFAVLFGYHTLFELLWAGRTPGKRATNLRVVRDGGYPIDPYASIVRNLVRLVDFMPPPYGIGLASVFFSAEYKRLGDYAAGTLVIKERPHAQLIARSLGAASPLVQQFVPLIHNVDQLTPEEFQMVRRFVERRRELEPAIQAQIATRLALPLMSKLGVTVAMPEQWHYAELLEAIERRYIEEKGLLQG
jgi:uncharacterized RDD family membrane protein YckC